MGARSNDSNIRNHAHCPDWECWMKKILVFNAEKEIAEGIALVLEAEFNCKALRTYNKDDAFKIITQFKPDLVIGCMTNMIGGDIDWVRRVRQQCSKEQLPIILIANQAENELTPQEQEELEKLVDYRLDCPFKPNALLSAVETSFYKDTCQ